MSDKVKCIFRRGNMTIKGKKLEPGDVVELSAANAELFSYCFDSPGDVVSRAVSEETAKGKK